MHKRILASLTLAAAVATSGTAFAQTAATEPTAGTVVVTPPARSDAPSRNMAPGSELPPAVSTHDPRPPAPSPIVGRKLTLVRQAGIGGPVAYARGGVLELGGAVSFMGGHKFTNLTVTPQVGFFLTNNFELSAIVNLAYTRDRFEDRSRTESQINLTAVIEPSVHLPIVDHLFVFGGLGVGVAYHENYGTGFALAPRVGFDIMVGRSGILSPAFNLSWSTNSTQRTTSQTLEGESVVAVRTLIGASLGYRVMF